MNKKKIVLAGSIVFSFALGAFLGVIDSHTGPGPDPDSRSYRNSGSIALKSGRLAKKPVAARFLPKGERWELRAGMGRKGASNRLALRGPGIDRRATGVVSSSFFGSVAIPFSGEHIKKKWWHVRAEDKSILAGLCSSEQCEQRRALIERTLERARGRPFLDQLQIVNSIVNRSIRYDTDRSIYGELDHWAPPIETIDKGRGDCEDFAILKLAALRELGVPEKSLSVVILRDKERNLFHAVMAFSTNRGHFILDNVRSSVLRDDALTAYLPLYSISAGRSWIHGFRDAPIRVADKTDYAKIAPGEGFMAGSIAVPSSEDYRTVYPTDIHY